MIGAIAGDIIGSVYEGHPIKTKVFPLFSKHSKFTDDTVLTIAIADAILHKTEYSDSLIQYGRQYPDAGYGMAFYQWIFSHDHHPYNSWGNGSAMRVSPVGFAFDAEAAVLEEAERTAAVSHNHPEGIKGAQATALAIFLARKTRDKRCIQKEIQHRFGYDLDRRLDDIRPGYRFDVSCQGSVPEAVIAFLESEDFEDSIRNAISLGGDSDTIACITGGISQSFYGSVPENIVLGVRRQLPEKMLRIIDRFNEVYGC